MSMTVGEFDAPLAERFKGLVKLEFNGGDDALATPGLSTQVVASAFATR